MIIKKSNQKKAKKELNISENAMLEETIISNKGVDIASSVEEEKNIANEPEIDLFNIESIDFTERQERRRGSRRRGYRRIDDRNLVSRAQEEAENIKKSAFEEGYRLGLEKANADLENFRNEFVHFMNARKDVFEYIAPDILEISVDIARTIIKKELESDPQVLLNTIIDVLKTISKNESKIVIKEYVFINF